MFLEVLDILSAYTTNMPLWRHLPVGDMEQMVGMLLTGQTQRQVGRHFEQR